jgi:simple sugar transport system substrate-binding protein
MKERMKKLIVIGLAFILLVVLVACNGNDNSGSSQNNDNNTTSSSETNTETDTDTSADDKKIVIAYVLKYLGTSWEPRQWAGLQEFMDKHPNVDARIAGSNSPDPLEQNRVVEDLIAEGVDVIAICPDSTEASAPVMAKAQEAGILTLGHEAAGMSGLDYDVEAFDNAAYGEHLAKFIAEKSGGKGEYTTFVGSLTAASHNAWAEGGLAYMKEEYPDVKIDVEKNESHEDIEEAYQKTLELLKAYPNLNMFQGSAMTDVLGIGRAVDESGLQDKTAVAGTATVTEAQQYLETNAIDMISFWDPGAVSYILCEVALRALEEKEINAGDDLGYTGYESIGLDGNIISGNAWIDVTLKDIEEGNLEDWHKEL